jgi:hypothetical protein
MSLATREQKEQTTDFVLCRGFWFFWLQKNNEERLNKNTKTTGKG